MSSKPKAEFMLKLTSPGVSFERAVSEQTASQIMNLVMTGNFAPPVMPNGGNTKESSGEKDFAANNAQLADLTIKQFVAIKRPNNFYERVACLAYYLTHFSGTPHFKTKDISKANTDAAASKFTNAAVFVNDATTKYAYLSAAGRGNKQITTFGEQVVDALPDREKVKQLHDENKSLGRKRGRKAAKKKPKK